MIAPSPQRRGILQAAAALCAAAAVPAVRAQAAANVVVIGGGFGGATAAKYLRLFAPSARVMLVEPNAEFISCPMSNRVLHGGLALRDLTRPYDRFAVRHGVTWVRAAAEGIDPQRRQVVAGGQRLPYDHLIVAPGVDLMYDNLPGLETAVARQRVPHAWKAGEQTQHLRRMLTDLPDNGTVLMHIPKVPFRCPPGPYERASLIATYLKVAKPKARLLVFDANPEIQAKKDLFEHTWKSQYPGIIRYEPNAEIESVDAAQGAVTFKVHGRVRADVMNIIPPQRAGVIAHRAGLANVGNRWCGVDFLSYESTAVPQVYVIGDSMNGPGLPKSGHMANQEAKVCAMAIALRLAGQPPVANPIIANTCYSFVSQQEVIHVAAVYRYDAAKKLMVAAPGAGGLSERATIAESVFAMAWATNILNDTLG